MYCGASPGGHPAYAETAQAVGFHLASEGYRLVYGGGQVGLMGVLADAAVDAGGGVTGVIPDFLHHREIAHPRVADMRIVSSMHERKHVMAEESDAFIALPGGIGTMEELFEIWTWSALGRHTKPVGLINVNGYYDGLLAFLDRMQADGFVQARHRAMLFSGDDIAALLASMADYNHPGMIPSLERARM
ncbi:putative cytokinin riboside 5'-monophosphate phosphoribohydrolase [Glycocaulis albus]|uniref:Cytokinin riboside 5'-monophosphate phosphoribohydrolase n=1 Tax=Glycocaulis albus TaxID=1382801 RepID=A0ABQ1XXP5_9PROT|nr:putative cytokinin riboside 5'-monophosphate phosphoribohydrolase [Glycocaulis albus]